MPDANTNTQYTNTNTSKLLIHCRRKYRIIEPLGFNFELPQWSEHIQISIKLVGRLVWLLDGSISILNFKNFQNVLSDDIFIKSGLIESSTSRCNWVFQAQIVAFSPVGVRNKVVVKIQGRVTYMKPIIQHRVDRGVGFVNDGSRAWCTSTTLLLCLF